MALRSWGKWGCPLLVVAFLLLLMQKHKQEVSAFRTLTSHFGNVKRMRWLCRTATPGVNEELFRHQQQCWAVENQKETEMSLKDVSSNRNFRRNGETYRLPSNLTDAEIRKLKSDERFRYRIRQLLEFKDKHGRFDVKRSDDIALCNWIVTQRCEYRLYMDPTTRQESLLTKERIEQLTKVGFDWKYPPENGLTASWLKWYSRLEKYEEKHGHVRVKSAQDEALFKWVSNQRQAYRRWKQKIGQSRGMTQERADKLEALGMVWSMRASGLTVYDKQWNKRLEELKEFHDKHGNFLVPRASPLGEWVAHQRKEYRDKKKYNISALTDERESILRQIGFDFDGVRTWMTQRWSSNFELLQAFYKQHNHTHVPASQAKLRNWASIQRVEYNRLCSGKPSSMTQQHVDQLEAIGFSWDLRGSAWMEQYQKLRKYYKANNNTLVPTIYPPDPAFGNWITTQRSKLRRARRGEKAGGLTEKQMKLLDEVWLLGDDMCVKEKRYYVVWNSMLDELLDFQRVHGHCRVPQNYPENPRLGRWVTRQRSQYRLYTLNKASTMTPERIKALEDNGFEWSAVNKRDDDLLAQKQKAVWNQRLEDLKTFHNENGHFSVPKKYEKSPKLHRWVCNTRQEYKKFKNKEPSTLSRERAKALDDIGFEALLKGVNGTWKGNLESLKTFQSEYGHCRVPQNYKDPKLSRWAAHQRTLYQALQQGKQSSLSQERIRQLEDIGFEWILPRGRKKSDPEQQ